MFSKMLGPPWFIATYIKLIFGNSLCFGVNDAGGGAVALVI